MSSKVQFRKNRKHRIFKYIAKRFTHYDFYRMVPKDEFDEDRDNEEQKNCEDITKAVKYPIDVDELGKITYKDFMADQRRQLEEADDDMIMFLLYASKLIKNGKIFYYDKEHCSTGNKDHILLEGFIMCDGGIVFTQER